jgi:hypothetical protein
MGRRGPGDWSQSESFRGFLRVKHDVILEVCLWRGSVRKLGDQTQRRELGIHGIIIG